MLVRTLKFIFLHACIDMTSPEVVCLSSDDEPIFERNQRLIEEHREREDRQNIQDHLSRVLDEVKEGKRKGLCIYAHPEPSSIPRVVPLDRSLAVTVAYEPEDLHFNIMSQESKTGSLSPPPVVKSKALRYEALLYTCTITNIDQISTLLKYSRFTRPRLVYFKHPRLLSISVKCDRV